jgi:phage protein U
MTEVMMMLGEYRFSLSTAAYQQLQRTAEFRWPAQDRIGRLPARQFIGAGNDGIELEGSIYPEFKGGLNQALKLRETAAKGKPLRLVDGQGKNWGLWCIERVEETRQTLFADGTPRKIEFRLSLGAYGDDKV